MDRGDAAEAGTDAPEASAVPEAPEVPEARATPEPSAVPQASATPDTPAPRAPEARLLGFAMTTWREVLLFLGLLFAFGFTQQFPAWNEYSRLDLTRALVEQGTTRIDAYEGNTGDKSTRDGHWYSDKAPGTSLIGVPVYALQLAIGEVTGNGAPTEREAVQAIAWLVSGVLTALLAVLLLRFLRPAVGEGWALTMAIAYGLGSLAFPFATMLFGHAATAFFLFAGFYAAWRARTVERRAGPYVLAAGFLLGWAVLVDLSAGLGLVIIGLYVALCGAWRGRIGGRALAWLDLRSSLLLVAGGLVPALILAVYNTVTFGSPASVGYQNLQQGGFAEGMSQGILGVSLPRLDSLTAILVGPRGLLRLTPWFVLVPAGLLALRRRGLRAEILVCAAVAFGYLALNAGYYLPFGGWTPGPRFLTPGLPFAAVLVALAPRRVRPVTIVLVGIGIVVMVLATMTMPNAPEKWDDPLLQLWLPRFLGADLVETGSFLSWGLAGAGALLALVAGLAIAETGLVASFSRGRLARAVTAGTTAVLLVLVLAFSTPLIPWPSITAASDGGIQATAVSWHPDGERGAQLQAGFWNRGPRLENVKVVFTVQTGDGASWKAWVGDVTLRAGERRMFELTWDGADEPAGDYPFSVSIVSQRDERVIARIGEAGVIRLP